MAPDPDRQPDEAVAPLADQASNAERVPAEGVTAEQLDEHAAQHPAVDPGAEAGRADLRRAAEPSGLHTRPQASERAQDVFADPAEGEVAHLDDTGGG